MRAARAVRAGAASRAFAIAVVTVVAVAIGTEVSAHRRDEYLQAARLAIEPDRVQLQLDLTPGITVAETIIADLDSDRDGSLSDAEKRAYVEQVLRAITLTVDNRPLDMQPKLTAARFPSLDAFRTGEGTIQMQLDAALPRAVAETNGTHRLEYRNEHFHAIGAYLANALVPDSDRIAIGTQERDMDQRHLTVEYELRGSLQTSTRIGLMTGFACAAIAAAFLLRRYEVVSARRGARPVGV